MNFKKRLNKIVVHQNLIEFFKDLVKGAIRNQNVDADEMAEFYLVQLLADFQKSERMRSRCPQTGHDEPLALTYLRALNSKPGEKENLLRNLGDRSLYLSGFFSEHLQNTIVGLKYYTSMGGQAYDRVARSFENNNQELSELFHDLAKNFIQFVDILSEVSEAAGIHRDQDILRLYEKWLQTGSERTAKFLTEAGIPLQQINPDQIQ